MVTVHYTGGWMRTEPGARNSIHRWIAGSPSCSSLGVGQVISGWDLGVATMQVGGKRTLVLPAAHGYGQRGAGGLIPPGATLIFDVELLGFK